ncbi:MAG: RsmD family RNA methyltransferase, partial [Clostridia bacterium]|nr:RsmD family RNA methyltransferase [Clostridia bacterium]
KVFNLDADVLLDFMKEPFDLIFIDPPYALDVGVKAVEKIAKKGLLKQGGVLIFERDKPFEGDVEGLEKYDERKYGKTVLTFFRPIEG